MNIGDIEYIIEGKKSGKDLYSLYKDKVDLFKVPFNITEEVNVKLTKILKGKNADEIVTALFLLSKFKKEDNFDFHTLSKFLNKRDYQISLGAISAFNHSNSLNAEKLLIEYIVKPKNDSFGEDAIDILAKILSSKASIIELVRNSPLMKGQTKSSVKYLIYRLSFNPKYKDIEEVKSFLQSNKMIHSEKYSFKGWTKSTSGKIVETIAKRVNKIHEKPSNKSNTSQTFYTIESEYYYSMYRIVLDHNPNTFIKVSFGLHPLASHSWGLKNVQFGLRLTDEIEFKSLDEFNNTITTSINNWKASISDEIEILENSTLDQIHKKSNILNKSSKLNQHSYSGYINWLAFNNRKEDIQNIGKRALNDKDLNLNETWIEYFNNLDKITVTNML